MSVFLWCLTLKTWTAQIFETSEAGHATMHLNLPEDDLQLHYCGKPKSCVSDVLVSLLFQTPDQCNGYKAPTNLAKSHPVHHPAVTAASQPVPADRNIKNGEEKVWTLGPTSDPNATESKQLWLAPSFGQPTPAPNNQSLGDPVEHLGLSFSGCSILDSQSDTSAMISDNIALRYA